MSRRVHPTRRRPRSTVWMTPPASPFATATSRASPACCAIDCGWSASTGRKGVAMGQGVYGRPPFLRPVKRESRVLVGDGSGKRGKGRSVRPLRRVGRWRSWCSAPCSWGQGRRRRAGCRRSPAVQGAGRGNNAQLDLGFFGRRSDEPTLAGKATSDKCVPKDGSTSDGPTRACPARRRVATWTATRGRRVRQRPARGKVSYYDGLEGTEHVRTKASSSSSATTPATTRAACRTTGPPGTFPPADGGATR